MISTALDFIKKKIASRGKTLEALQVEITSRCNAKCIMCPRTGLQGWKNGDMTLAEFQNLSELIQKAGHVHLQGWGEPLLHPDLFKMVKMVKNLAARAGITTNGLLLNNKAAEQLIEADLDIMAVSLAGADRKTHEAVRRGTDFDLIIRNIGSFSSLKAKLGSTTPTLVISFLMLKQNITQLPGVVRLAEELGAQRVAAINLDLVWNAEIDGLRVFTDTESRAADYDNIFREAEKTASSAGISLRCYPLYPDEQPTCEADPLKNVYVAHDGCLAPCPYLGLPAKTIPRYFRKELLKTQRLCLGNINKQSFDAIWNNNEYRQFRQHFARRLSITSKLYSEISCDFEVLEKAYELDQEYAARLRSEKPPPPCYGCWKLYGV